MTGQLPPQPENPAESRHQSAQAATGTAPASSSPHAVVEPGEQYVLPGMAQLIEARRTEVQVWQGQFPPPEAIERYEAILPGTFNRLLVMAERAQIAGIEQSHQANRYLHIDRRRGHLLGAAVAVLACIGSLLALKMGSPTVACVFLSVPVMAVARTLLETGRPRQARDRSPTPPGQESD